MKKLKKNSNQTQSINNYIETKCSRITIDSRVCNEDKFNQLYNLTESVKVFKNTISKYCYDNKLLIISDVKDFLTHYKKELFNNPYLNAWERQTIYQEITGHYAETLKRYLSKAKFIVTQYEKINNDKFKSVIIQTKLTDLCKFIDKNSYLVINNNINSNKKHSLDFDIEDKLKSLNEYLNKYQLELSELKSNNNFDKEINKKDKDRVIKVIKLEKLIKSYNNLIAKYNEISLYKQNKSNIYERAINLIINKKLRLINQIKCHEYKTGTHARHLDNAQISIMKDESNKKYQYFLKIRANSNLKGREPKLTDKNKEIYQELLNKYNEDNFIYLPISYNQGKLKSINRSIENIIGKDFPQILIKSEQLRINSKSRKVHIIFNYEEENKLGNLINSNFYEEPNKENTLGLDINCKNNLLTDSQGKIYDGIFKNNHYLKVGKSKKGLKADIKNNAEEKSKTQVKETLNRNLKSKFMENVNQIVELYSKQVNDRTEKEKYCYEKLLRTNESLLKSYLSTLVKDWKQENILHLVLEDLNLMNDKVEYKSYYEHAGIKIKYSRLSRLLRLNQIKHWIANMAKKESMLTHFINPAYSSKECNNCHCINDKNRQSQELFKCVKCNNELNADYNSALNSKARLLNKSLRYKLSEDNVYLCARSKNIYYKNVKGLIEEEYKNSSYQTFANK